MPTSSQAPNGLPSTEQLLIAGGDARLALDPLSGRNKYGCQPLPDPQLLSFSSSTASIISAEGFDAANRLRQTLLTAIATSSHAAVYSREMQRIRREWLQLCGLSDLSGLELVFCSSGTDLHAVAAQYTASEAPVPPLLIMVEANETGSGVAAALTGTENNAVEVEQVSIRLNDGMPRPPAEIDAEIENLAAKAAASNRRMLLILVDQSKTGLIAPSPACAMALHRRYPNNIEVLVDACQFRIATSTLRAYLEQGFMVALTGSKFLNGPSFSATLLLPPNAAKRLQQRALPRGLLPRSFRADWPDAWRGAEQLTHAANFGLLLRCEVALTELRRFRAVPEPAIVEFIHTFAEAVHQRLMSDPYFEPLPSPLLDRRPLIAADCWDQLPTIFPFLLYAPQSAGRRLLNREQTQQVYQKLPFAVDYADAKTASIRCQLGQPVACGIRNGIAISALRLCLSSRLITEAAADNDRGISVIKEAMKVLDKVALLISYASRTKKTALL
ncbi:hypothetical protein [Candidatus Methylobacter oryzae]|uniref:Aminotransferase class V-fold PLP-dependent enzyme n=1 Tax=Candidatus Methylobacter oryzae TaxID=2497749 RepID=A0ABY3C979_9GAMM|nr:hypothetical protein [Candidatus Methylobacter oryzae]TRW93006.1 hypothetical protein EKO24_013805 [Candidatus Methylobacter oryzae]